MVAQNPNESRINRRLHTEEQIVAILKEAEEGFATPELCRKHGIGEPTFFRWKASYHGLDANQVRLLRLRPVKMAQSLKEGCSKKRRHTGEQIVAILMEAEEGMAVPELCSKHRISEMTFFFWKANYRGLDANQVRLLRLPPAATSQSSKEGRTKKGRHTEEQIVTILKEAEEGMTTMQLCSKHGISSPTISYWKANYSGLDANQMRLLRQRPAKELQSYEESRIKKRRHTEEQIVTVLKEAEEGMATPELCMKYGIVQETFFRWKAMYHGLDATQIKLLRLRPAKVSQSSVEGLMKRVRHTEEQIVAVLKEAEEGMGTPELRSKHGISELTLFRWKAKYSGLDSSQIRLLRQRTVKESRVKRHRHTQEQVVAILKEAEEGMAMAELLRKHGISAPTFFRWQASYLGLNASQAHELRLVNEENRTLRQLVAQLALEVAASKAVLASEIIGPGRSMRQ